uniref:Uncharacterized protein n=1 Tax=Terrapene triunguis TaxID=2587831 RepID=A0A674J9Z0_9SAUR
GILTSLDLLAVLLLMQPNMTLAFLDASSNWECLGSTICQSDENYCVTTYVGAGIGKFGDSSVV